MKTVFFDKYDHKGYCYHHAVYQKTPSCPAEITLGLINGRWKPLIIHWLLQDTLRFNQLQRNLGRITHRTLSKNLKEMEADGLVLRRDYREIPPRVEYSLTPRGKSLESVLGAMHDWALSHGDTL